MRTQLVVATLVLLLTACASNSPETAEAEGRAELALRSLVAAYASADTAILLDIFWPQATYDDFAEQHTYQGIEEIVGYVTGVHTWGDDVYMNVGRLHPTRGGAVAEWVFSAVQNRPLGDVVPEGTGREVVLNGVTIIEMEGDRIIRAADYVDTGSLLSQLGARIVPAGEAAESAGP